MILTCPECSTRYFVDDHKIAEPGRAVRCAACSAVWRIHRDLITPDDPPPQIYEDPISVEPDTPAKSPATPKHVKVAHEAHDGHVRHTLALVGACIGAVAGLGVIGVVFRDDVVRMWPQTSRVYAIAGLEAPVPGLVIDARSIIAQRELRENGESLRIAAEITNPTETALPAPSVRVRLRDQDGDLVLNRVEVLDIVEIPANGLAPFTLTYSNIPSGAEDIELTLTERIDDQSAPRDRAAGAATIDRQDAEQSSDEAEPPQDSETTP